MLMTEEAADHFMIGETVEVNGKTGEIKTVIEHTVEDQNGNRQTHRRVIGDTGDREINAGSSDVEVVGR